MVTIKVPSEIKVGGHTFRVVHSDDISNHGRRAEVDYKRLVISIVPDKKLSVKSEGLIHEWIHTINLVYLNGQVDSEDIVEPLAEGLWQILEQLGVEFDFTGLEEEKLPQ